MPIVHWQLPGIQSFRTQSGDLTSPITDQDYLEVLKMLGQPVSVDMSSWQEFSKVCLQLNLATWCIRLTEFRHTFGLPYVANTFLQHCRALEHLTILVRNENDFEWATQEQQQLQVASSIPPSRSPRTEAPVLSSCATPLTPVKLKSAILAVPRYLLARTLRSIAHGLSMYLERWIVKTCSERELRELQAHQGQFDERDMTYVVFDRSWQFPNLQLWHITRATDKLVFGPGAFQSGAFPRLRELSISGGVSCLTTLPAVTTGAVDGVENHHNNNSNVPVVPHFETWNLPKLEQLNLGDGVAHLFEIETLRYSPRLRSIHLCENITRVAQEMARITPPLPRWEWTLPQLTVLRLSGRPALSFRFTWLYSCPALEHLHVEDMTPVSFCGSAMGHLPIDNISYPSKSANGEQDRSQHSHGNTDTGELSDNHDNSNTTQSEGWSPITSKISSCYIQINSRKQICTLHLREMIHRFCYNVDRLVLKGSMDNREEWGEMDVGSALEIVKGLPNLERLVVNVGYKPTRVGEYGLVRASTETGEAITDKDAKNECWPAHMDLSTFVMEVYGMNIRVGVFRQIQTPCSC
ncbi:hypothetical protein BGW42_001604 [Actinomortierella wolfii]|nr:hypothetical protein BGW42_001604 [Actinomortierella wolfii]